MDISNLNSYEEFDTAFGQYRSTLILDKAQAKTNEYQVAVEAANHFRSQLAQLAEDDTQYEIIADKLRFWETVVAGTEATEPNINNPAAIEIVLTPVEEQLLADLQLAFKKQLRTKLVSSMSVSLDGYSFAVDEVSQSRMLRAIQTLNEEETIRWISESKESVELTKAQLQELLSRAVKQQTCLWHIY